jgi:glycosidase
LASPLEFTADTLAFHVHDYIPPTIIVIAIEYPEGVAVIDTLSEAVYLLRKSNELAQLSNLRLRLSDGSKADVLVKNRRKQPVVVRFDPKGKPIKNVKIKGEVNFWNARLSKMQLVAGIWQEEFVLSPGAYQYLLVVDGMEIMDPENPDRIDNNLGGNNSLLKVGKYNQEDLPFLTTQTITGNELVIGSTMELTHVYAYWDNQLIKSSAKRNEVIVELPDYSDVKQRSYLRVYACNESGFSNDILLPLEKGEIVTDAAQLDRTDRQTMIMYFMMVDRFRNGNPLNDEKVDDPEILPKANYYGGDLEGILQAMEEGYFSDLHVNTIWLSPITQNPKGAYGLFPDPRTRFSGYHGYWPVSSTTIDYRFGTARDLKSIVQKAHSGNQNILLDYVANHVHEEHPVYQLHPDWATDLYLPDGSLNTEKWDEYRLTTWFDTFLPTLDLRRPEVVEPMTDSAVFWIKEYGIDGFRHDATKHIDELFWRRLTEKLKQETSCNPMIYQIGETYGSPALINSYISTGMLDGQFDFNVYDNAVAAFARDDESFLRLRNTLTQSLQYYGYHNLMGNITGNQDKPRFISLAGGALRFDENAKVAGWKRDIGVGDEVGYLKLKLLHAFNLTIPGIPVIYYGDEIGLPGGNDPDNRRWMKFDNLSPAEKDVRNTVKELAGIRSTSMPLLYGDLQFLQTGVQILSFIRTYLDEFVIVFFNKSSDPYEFKVDIRDLSKKTVKSSFDSKFVIDSEVVTVIVPPMSFEVLISN